VRSIYYKPKLLDGKEAKLRWQIRVLYILDLGWPINEEATIFMKFLYYFKMCFGICAYLLVSVGEIIYVVRSINNIGKCIAGVAYHINLLENFGRTLVMIIKRSQLRKLLDEFYQNIYIEKFVEKLKLYIEIQSIVFVL